MNLSEAEKAKRRAERFSKPVKKEYGLLSKGDTSLVKSRAAQEHYFDEIRQYYKRYCKDNDEPDGLKLVPEVKTSAKTQSIDQILMALRKLREATLSGTPDGLHKQVYVFSTRIAILAGKSAVYAPVVGHLLSENMALLTDSERQWLASLQCLHLAHLAEYTQAFQILQAHGLVHIEKILYSLNTGNWVLWNRQVSQLDDLYCRRLAWSSRSAVLKTAINSIGKSYMQMKLKDLEYYTGAQIQTLRDLHCSWPVNEDDDSPLVVIRQHKK